MSNPVVDSRPKIQLPGDGRLLSDFAGDLGQALHRADIYRRNGFVVTINAAGDGFEVVTPEQLRTWAEQYLVCYKVKKIGDSETVVSFRRTMSNSDAAGVLASPQFQGQLNEVSRFAAVRMPVLRRDGYIELLPDGFDPESKILTRSGDIPIYRMPFGEAKRMITELLAEFAFADPERSRAVAVAAMLTVYGIGILPRKSLRPCFIYLANAEGAGKTLLVKVATVPVLGIAPVGAKAHDEDELRKVLLTAVLEGKPVLLFDNFKGRLSSESLEGLLSCQDWTGRVLGGSRSFTGENNVVVFVTGNGCTVSPDMRRRSLFVELFLEAERAEDLTFKQNLEVPVLLERRIDILSALWSLILDWHESMEPEPSRSHASFPDWARIIGGITEHAGFGCPLETAGIAATADTDGQDMRALVAGICNGSLTRAVTFDEVVTVARARGLFEDIIGAGEGDLNTGERSRFGRLLERYDGRLVGHGRFSVHGKGRARRYEVKKLTQDAQVAEVAEVFPSYRENAKST